MTSAGRWAKLYAVAALLAAAQATVAVAQVNPGTPWPATDALGRKVPVAGEAGPLRPDRFVGIFYFLWLSPNVPKSAHWDGPPDVSKVLQHDPDAVHKPDSPFWGPLHSFHYWGEPLFGYYAAQDPWVLRRHAMLLADAGIDVLIFDTTNALTYPEVWRKLGEVFQQVRAEGGRTPQIAFMVNTQAGKTAQRIYDDLYRPGLYRELWFAWQGKPLLLCDPQQASPELRAFFTLRKAHWPMQLVNTPYAWHWEAPYPQCYGYTDDPQRPEQVVVSVAQNLRASDARVTDMSTGEARGRSFHDGHMDATPGAVNHGYNLQEQWKRARELDPPFVLVTGWNEWVAQFMVKPGGRVSFCDQFNEEFSRDIEPMRGGHGDNYYYQLVANVRRHKGVAPLPTATPPATIRLDGGFEQWTAVGPQFRDHVGDTAARDFVGAGQQHYTNRSGRNDLVACKVARDAQYVYFYLQTREPIVPAGRMQGLWLLLDTDRNAATGWEGCDYLIGRESEPDGVWVERNAGGWQWKKLAKVPYRVAGNQLHLALPRALLGLAEGDAPLALDFKWADNLPQPGNVIDFYTQGDVAPEGRFWFRYASP